MAFLASAYSFHFAQPWWLVAGLIAAPMAYLSWKNLATLGATRRIISITLRVLVVLVLAMAIAQPSMVNSARQVTLIAVLDHSQSIPSDKQVAGRNYLTAALANKDPKDLFAVIDVADGAMISKLPGSDIGVRERNTTLGTTQTRLADGLQLAMAIAPLDTAARIVLVSDGNETAGDIRQAAQIAAANRIPIDVLPISYNYANEVVFRNLVAPVRARSGQTIPLRFVLSSVGRALGTINLTVKDDRGIEVPINLNPGSGQDSGMPVILKAGTNVFVASVPVGARGMHEFTAGFTPADPSQDSIPQNNSASAITFVAGPGHVLVVDTDGRTGMKLQQALTAAKMDVRQCDAHDFPDHLVDLLNCDAVILANVDCPSFTMSQQDMLVRYVKELGGGLVMTGGDASFGAGGWIGSPVAEILPIDVDPPQKKQMPKGALVLVIDHSGSMTGQKVQCAKAAAAAAVGLLSSRDYLGVIAFDSQYSWISPLAELTDKSTVYKKISDLGAGGGTDMHPPLQAAYEALKNVPAGVRHIILLTDGQTAGTDCRPLAARIGQDKVANITVSTVAIGDDADRNLLAIIAATTGGRFYLVQDPKTLPQILIKEAKLVCRSLIVEEKFTPKITFGVSEIVRGLADLPPLDGYVLTGPKGGLAQLIMATPMAESDPILSAGYAGLGKCVAFTSSADGKWAGQWLAWGGFDRFWEQVVRWAAKPSQSSDCEVFADVQGRTVTLTVESVDAEGKFVQFSQLAAQVIGDRTSKDLALTQVGPGRYRAEFRIDNGGSYVVNLRYRKPGSDAVGMVQSAISVPYAPEFHDLTDNLALLKDIAAKTGGRVINGDPKNVQLFDRAGVKFPQAAQPLTLPLLLVWLGLFLLDVAGRRITMDFKASFKWAVAHLTIRHKAQTGGSTLDRLKSRKQEYLEQLARKKKDASAAARYEAPATTIISDFELRIADSIHPKDREEKSEVPNPKAEKKSAMPAAKPTHLDQLLKAKRDKGFKKDSDGARGPDARGTDSQSGDK